VKHRAARWLREPLLHFLLAGGALFLLHGLLNRDASPADGEIVVSEARVASLAEGFARTWMRPPTAEELQGLVDDYVAEEVYYREALALGLDRDDTIVRRRLRQKLEFLFDDIASAPPPTDAQLQSWLEAHAAKFAEPERLSLQQVLFSPARRGDGARGEAERALAELRAGRGPADPRQLGDPTLLPPALESASLPEIAAAFGNDFADRLEEAPVGEWIGPVPSTFGLHLVRVDDREAEELPALAEIRPRVLSDWEAGQRRGANDAFLARLLAKYEVRIEAAPAEALERSSPSVGGGTRP